MIHIAETAVAENCYGLCWEVLDWNKSAMDFYRHLGSDFRENWRIMQIVWEDLKRLAAQKSELHV